MEKKRSRLYRGAVRILRRFYKAPELIGTENIPEKGAMLVGNHSKTNGPIISQLFLPGKNTTWCIGQIFTKEECRKYTYKDFWSKKPKAVRWIYKILAAVIAVPLSNMVNSCDLVPVYHDSRLRSTFRTAVESLKDGNNVVFPEQNVPHNNIVYEFQDKFVDTAKYYYKKTGEKLKFVPMYIAPRLHKVIFGKPIEFNPDAPIAEERTRICEYLMNEISETAYSLPRHTVVPYPNIPSREYPQNTREEAVVSESRKSITES